MSPWTRADLLAKTAVAALLAFALAHPDWHQFAGKAMTARAIGYPLLLSLPMLAWLATGRRVAYPGAASLLLTLPFLVDTAGNALDLYDRVERFDDACHFGNWALLSAAAGLLLGRRDDLPRWALAPLCTGLGAVTAVLGELAEYGAFVTDSPEVTTAYADTVLDLVLGTSGALVAGLLCTWAAGRAAPPARGLDDGAGQALTGGAHRRCAMRSTHTLCCPLCSLRFVNQPTLEHHVREDHAPAQQPEHRETLSVLASPLRRAQARRQRDRLRALTWR